MSRISYSVELDMFSACENLLCNVVIIGYQYMTQQLKQIFALTGTRDVGVIIVVPKEI